MKRKTAHFMKATTAIAVVGSVIVAVPQVEASGFSDVLEKHYFYQDVNTLKERGVIDGFGDGTFRPNQAVTRGQAAKMLAKSLQLDTVNVANPQFSDIPQTHPYYGEIAALKAAGIIDGYPDGTFRSQAHIERNHMAKMLTVGLQLPTPDDVLLPFVDVAEAYYTEVAALYAHQITTGKTQFLFDGKASVTRGQMAAFIMRGERAVVAVEEPAKPVDGTWSFDVDSFTADSIVLGDYTYRYHDDIAPLFSDINSQALQGAQIEATFVDGEMTSVQSIQLVNDGTNETPVILHADVAIDHLEVAANDVLLSQITVREEIVVAGTVTGQLFVNTAQVDGQMVVKEAPPIALASLQGMRSSALNLASLSINFFGHPVDTTSETLSTSDFITRLYSNLFNRAPDSGGLNYWTQLLETPPVLTNPFPLIVERNNLGISSLAGPVSDELPLPPTSIDLTTTRPIDHIDFNGIFNQMRFTPLSSAPISIGGEANFREMQYNGDNLLQLRGSGEIRSLRLTKPAGRISVGAPPGTGGGSSATGGDTAAGPKIDNLTLLPGVNPSDALPPTNGKLPQVGSISLPDGTQIPLPTIPIFPTVPIIPTIPTFPTLPVIPVPDINEMLIATRLELDRLIQEYSNQQPNDHAYSQQSIDAYNALLTPALEQARTATGNGLWTAQTQLTQAFQKARALLVPLDLHNLRAELTTANEAFTALLAAEYTADSYTRYTNELAALQLEVTRVLKESDLLALTNTKSTLLAFNTAAQTYLIDAATPGHKEALRTQITTANVPAADYTAASYAAYTAALKTPLQEAQAILEHERRAANVLRATEQFTQAVQTAKALLEINPLKTYKQMLQQRMDAVVAINAASYTPASVSAYETAKNSAFEAAKTVLDNETNAENVERAINAFDAAMNSASNLLHVYDLLATYKTMLQERMNTIVAINAANYTPASVSAYETAKNNAFEAAKTVLDNETNAENVERAINAFTTAMNSAINLLQYDFLTVHKQMLQERMDAIVAINAADYTAASVSAYETAKNTAFQAAQNVLDNETNAQNVLLALHTFNVAMNSAKDLLVSSDVLTAYKNMLQKRMNAIGAINASYTPESVSAYETAKNTAFQAAQNVLDNETNAENVERAINAFDAAMNNAKDLLQVDKILAKYKQMLQERMNTVVAIDASYTPESISDYETAKNSAFRAAQTILDKEINAENVERAINNFDAAISDATQLLQVVLTFTFTENITGSLDLMHEANIIGTATATTTDGTMTLTMTGLKPTILTSTEPVELTFVYNGRTFLAKTSDHVTWTLEEKI